MPELPEVETCRRDLDAFFTGSPIAGIRLYRNDLLVGKTFEFPGKGWVGTGIGRHGKTLMFGLSLMEEDPESGGLERVTLYLLARFGMSGGWRRTESPLNPVHTHLEIRFSDRLTRLLWVDPRRFGRLELTDDLSSSRILSHTGPDALSLSPSDLETIVRQSSRSIREILMDQRSIAGIGNIYMAEILFQAGISPFTKGEDLSPIALLRLHRAIHSILAEAIRSGGSTIHSFTRENGEEGGFQKWHLVYGRQGLPCTRCALPIQRNVINQRALYFCSSCQGPGKSTIRRIFFRDSREI